MDRDSTAKVVRTANGYLASCGLLWPVDLSGFPGREGGQLFLESAFRALPDPFRAAADAALGRQGEIKFCQAFYSIEQGPLATEWQFRGSYQAGAELEMIPLEAPGADAKLYMKGTKLVVSYDDSGTTRYYSLDLAGGTGTWSHSTSAP